MPEHRRGHKGTQMKTSTHPKRPSHSRNNNFSMGPTDSLIQLQDTIGNQGVKRLINSNNNTSRFDFAKIGILQPKLKVSQLGDEYEQEACRIADQVMAAQAHPIASSAPLWIQRLADLSAEQTDSAPASVDRALAGPGMPLESTLRQELEQKFGYDFSQVRVHSDLAATQSAQEVSARAYTAGPNIVFGAGQFKPGTQEGRRLIAHELTHVIQQSGAHGTGVAVQRQPVTVEEAVRAFSDAQRAYQETAAVAIDLLLKNDIIPERLPVWKAGPERIFGLPSLKDLNSKLTKLAARGGREAESAQTMIRALALENAKARQAGQALEAARRGTMTHFGAPTTTGTSTTKMPESVKEPPSKPPHTPSTQTHTPTHTPPTTDPHLIEGASHLRSETRWLKFGNIIEAFIPTPLDVLDVALAFFGTIAEGAEQIRDKNYASGFSMGLAASLLAFDETWVRQELLAHYVFPTIGEQVAGYEGIKERAGNKGKIEGFKFGRQLNDEQRNSYRKEGFEAMAKKRLTLSGNFTRDDVISLSVALLPIIMRDFEAWRRQEEERRKKMYEEEERKKWGRIPISEKI